jgi:predicted metalloprotease with PDZ domain
MTNRHKTLRALSIAITLATALAAHAQQTEYTFSFPNAVHHTMQVEATYHGIPAQPFRVEMARSSPGRYASFEFASNIIEAHFTDGHDHPLAVTKINPRTWQVLTHDGTVRVRYKLFGDRVDGTFLAIDTTHAHINFPATVLWAKTLENRPTQIKFVLPEHSDWKIATQLYPTPDPTTFTAPNLQYLMDSPAELSNFRLRTFEVPPISPGGKTQTIRVVAHSQATDAEFDTYFAGIQKLVREEQAVYGELPNYEPGYYTFLADALPWDNGDGMEHRNSTVMTGRRLSLGTAAHEYFHNWNVERIRPEGLEPFNFRDVNMSGEMFLAEGFTEYYGELAMLRTGLTKPNEDNSYNLEAFAGDLSYVLHSPSASYRSAMDMSRLAPLVDGSSDDFPKDWINDFVSYYSFGDVIALGLDLTLRARSNSQITLDDFMRAMWLNYGKPNPGSRPAPGLVGHPYTIADVQTQLAAISKDPAFAADFVKRYIAGTEKLDYAPLFLRAGFILRTKTGPPTLGLLRLTAIEKPGKPDPAKSDKADSGLRVAAPTIIGSPAYNAGIDLDDEILSIAGTKLAAPDDLETALKDHKAGDQVEILFLRRGQQTHATATLANPDELELVPVESTGATLTPNQKQFREAWLNSKAK